MHPELNELSLPQLVEQLDDLEGKRTPVGWTPEDAVMRSAIERRIMELVARQHNQEERRKTMRVPCNLTVVVQSKEQSVRAQATDMGAGGIFVSTRKPFAIGTPVRVEVRGTGTEEHGLKVRGAVAWTAEEEERRGIGIAFTHMDNDSHERRVRRFVVELLRNRADVGPD